MATPAYPEGKSEEETPGGKYLKAHVIIGEGKKEEKKKEAKV